MLLGGILSNSMNRKSLAKAKLSMRYHYVNTPERGALPDCATPRHEVTVDIVITLEY